MEEAPWHGGRHHRGVPPPQWRPAPPLSLPAWTLWPGTIAGDLVSRLGWKPPIRSTAMAEMQRGVVGNPRAWMAATGIVPRSARQAVAATPATVQEKWFVRFICSRRWQAGLW